MAIERFFTGGHKIEKMTTEQGPRGGVEKTWKTHLADIDGKLWPLSGDRRLSADKQTYFADHRFITGPADITEKHRYQDPDGNVYRIKAVNPRKRPDGSGHLEIDLELIR